MKNAGKIYRWLLLSGLLAVIGWLANQRSHSPQLLDRYAHQLNRYYQEQEQKVTPTLSDSLFWQRIYQAGQRTYPLPTEAETNFLREWADASVVWILYDRVEAVFWTDNTLVIPKTVLSRLYSGSQTETVQLNSGYYVLKSRQLETSSGPVLVVGAIPIKYAYTLGGSQLDQSFAPGLTSLPDNLIIDATQGEAQVSDPQGEVLFYLSRGPDMFDVRWYLISLAGILLAFLFFTLWINQQANYLARKYHPWLGAGLIIAAVTTINIWYNLQKDTAFFTRLSLFHDTSTTIVFRQSLGEFFFTSLALLWLMVFFHREFRIPLKPQLRAPWPAVFTTAAYWLSIISLLLVILLFQNLVLGSGLIFDFEYIFGLDIQTLAALISGLIILLATFLFNHRLLQATSRLGTPMTARLVAAAIALILAIPVLFLLNLQLPVLTALAMAVVYVIGLDYTLDRPSISLTFAVLWLLFFAVSVSMVIYSIRQKADRETQKEYIKALAEPRDQVLEEAVGRLRDRLEGDTTIWKILEEKDSFPLPLRALYPLLQTYFSSDPYLFQHYEFELFALDSAGTTPLIQGQRPVESMRLLDARRQAMPTSVEKLSYWPHPYSEEYTYLFDLSPPQEDLYFLMAIRYRTQKEQRVYGDLLENIPYKRLPRIAAYDYAIYGGLRPLKQEGNPPSDLRIPFSELPVGVFYPNNTEERRTVWYRSEKDFTVVLSRQKIDLLQALSLFSFLFSLLVLMVILLSVINYYLQALPDTLEFSSLKRASLRNRIQRAILLLILGSFILVGFVTAAFFRRNALRAGSEQLNEKAKAVLADLQRNIGAQEANINGLRFLEPLIDPIADIHNMDINVYDLHGQLRLTSAGYLFRQGMTAPLMDPIALHVLRSPTRNTYRSRQRIGQLLYQSAYVPIRDDNSEIIAYLELPYFANDRELRNDLQSFLSALLNVYVFLLLLAGAIALFVAESITQPISKIGQKLSQFRLGHNEPLEWKSPDEIGQLIAEYNLMIEKLEDSTQKLRQSEREGAWREMAKQVAHEIKNPLTPMKLNIQHLLRVQQQDPERASAMISEVAQSIIQQIDGLSRIAGEFSNFAKMPQAENEVVDLNKLVASVFNLYAKGDHGATTLQLELPEAQLQVFVDPTQLMRVINNLVKNALQAIPDQQEGQVAIRLQYTSDKTILSVADNGSGIPEALREKVFYPNFTTKNSGMGLGLAMSRSIVNAAGGRIYFETAEEKGTTFFVELPLIDNKVE
ncbi:MAG: ATP-binding protein [Saprospiraceae bacterium]|nr:GHKL domain-containing protein [Lewinella sp.]